MIICDREFEDPDPGYPGFSACEVDVFDGKDYRLTVRKDLKRDKYQAFRSWHTRENQSKHANALAYQPQSFLGDESGFYDVEVVCEGSLIDVLTYANEEHRQLRPLAIGEGLGVCLHEGSQRERAVGCSR